MTNFFITDEKEPFRTNSIFGLCDNEDENPAYSDTDDSKNWQATVENSDNLEVQFQSIDKRIVIKDYEGNQESNCDGMLLFSDRLYLVELKVQRRDWRQKAIGQLKNTIHQMKQYNSADLGEFKKKKAFACNKKHPNFSTLEASEKNSFYNETGFRLDVQANIKLK